MGFAEVAVDARVAQQTFSYSVPKGLEIMPGQLVWVPFGPRVLQGVVFELTDTPQFEPAKDIIGALGSAPVLTPAQVALALWISRHYMCSLFASASLMLPPGFSQRVLTYFSAIPPRVDSRSGPALTSAQEQVLHYVRKREKVELRQLEKAFKRIDVRTVATQLVRKGLMAKRDELEKPRVRPKVREYVRLAISVAEWEPLLAQLRQSTRGPKQLQRLELALEALRSSGTPMTRTELSKHAGISRSDLESLAEAGLVSFAEEEVFRDPLAHRVFQPTPAPDLTDAQERIWRELAGSMARQGNSASQEGTPAVFLLHGVTGSGKTEIYLRALAEAVKRGRRGIVMVPEIALTPQTIGRFLARFPGRVAVLHSRLSIGEQFDEWRRIKAGEFDVVIGSRSAVFAPVPNLGLVVLDEEHEWTYKQLDSEPRYHSRDVAMKLAELTDAAVVLGSATPDIASYYDSEKGRFRLLELPERITSSGWDGTPTVALPGRLSSVQLVDLRQELRAGNRSIFSRALLNAATVALAAGEQVILFLNRRGTATFVNCRDCGFVVKCKRCEVALTYHAAEDDMICHLCDYRTLTPDVCPSCGSPRIRYLGVGTQKVEEEARKAFPGARILRWDRDAAKGKRAHEEILEKFTAHEADILIGTQMIAKGLDLPRVTLAGIVCADIGLHLPDLRAGEHTFQILTQVAGRAGRGILQGKTIIQTYSPDHYAVVAASQQDYGAFYRREIAFRREHDNPPFSELAKLVYVGTNNEKCQKEAARVCALLRDGIACDGMGDFTLIGPAPCYVGRLRGRFRWQIIVRGREPQRLLASVQLPTGWSIDIDPVSLL